MLVLSRRKNESLIIEIGGVVVAEIKIVEIRDFRGAVRLGLTAPPHVKLYRDEVFQQIQAERGANATSTGMAAPIAGSAACSGGDGAG